LQSHDFLLAQAFVSMPEQIKHVDVLGLEAERMLEGRNFGLSVSGNFLRSCEPRPDIGPCRLLTSRGFQKGYCFRTLAAFAIVDAKKKVSPHQRGLDLKRPAKLRHSFRNSILELV